MIRGVFFDFDGTLYDRDLALRRLAQEQHAMFKDELDVDQATFVSHLLALDAHGQARPSRFHHRLVEELGLRKELAEKLEATFREHFSRHCLPPEDCMSTLQSLKSSGMKLAIITNEPVTWQMRKIRQCGIEPFFDNILVSEAEGIAKPHDRTADVQGTFRDGARPRNFPVTTVLAPSPHSAHGRFEPRERI